MQFTFDIIFCIFYFVLVLLKIFEGQSGDYPSSTTIIIIIIIRNNNNNNYYYYYYL